MLLQLEEIVKFFSDILDRLDVPYAIIGGVASITFGRSRSTKDVDFVISLRQADIAKLLDAIEDSGFEIDRRHLVEEKMRKNGVGKLIWTKRKYSVDFRIASFHLDEEAIKDAEVVPLFGKQILFAPPEDLIVYKLARFDEVDRGDIIGILKMQGDKLSWKRIERLAADFAAEREDEFVLKNLETVNSWINRDEERGG